MSQQSRILLIIAVCAIAGVSALAFLANRYAKALEGHANGAPSQETTGTLSSPGEAPPAPRWKLEATARALVQVDGFIGVRMSIRSEIDRNGGELGGRAEFTEARTRALAEEGVDPAVYSKVRGMFRTWRTGRLEASSAMAAAFEQRREQLERLDLGSYEALDS